MTSMKTHFRLRTLGMAIALGLPMVAANAADAFTGNIGVFSRYILRGITNSPENDSAVLQGGVDYVGDSGLYLGYWGSTLGYCHSRSFSGGADTCSTKGFENDLYGGWGGKMGDVSYSLGIIQYYYMNVADSNLTEFNPTIGFGPVTLGAKYLLTDGWWGNKGDTYWTASYSADLPSNFKFGAVVGYYTYKKGDNAKMCYPSPANCGVTKESSAFRHVDLTLSHPIAKSGADMSLTYTLGGKDRTGTNQKDALWFGVKYGFDL